MILVIGTIRLPAGRIEQARGAMRRMVEASRAEDGCLAYSYAEDVLEPGLIHVTERWRDEASLAAHLRTSHLQHWRDSWPDLEIGDRQLTRYVTNHGIPA